MEQAKNYNRSLNHKYQLKYLLDNDILKKSKAFGNTYGDTTISDCISRLNEINDIYFFVIEKIEFSIGTYLNGSINGMNVVYRSLLSDKVFKCENTTGHHHLTSDKKVFYLDHNDYITSFVVVYGRGDIMRNIRIKTKNNKTFTVKFEEKASYSYDGIAEEEIIPAHENLEKKNMLASFFYGVGGHIHKIGCYYLEEKFYLKILAIYKLANFRIFKKNFGGKDYEAILSEVEKRLALLENGKASSDKMLLTLGNKIIL